MNIPCAETTIQLPGKNTEYIPDENDLHVALLFDHSDSDAEYYKDIELATASTETSLSQLSEYDTTRSTNTREIRLFSWTDHIFYLLFVPEILLHHYRNITLASCNLNDTVDTSISSWIDITCTSIAISAINGQWNTFVFASVIFLIVSIYMYKVSLYHVAPYMFRIDAGSSRPLYKSILYQCITSLHEIMLIIIIGCIVIDHVLLSIPIMLVTTSIFSWITIVVSFCSLFLVE